MTFQLLFDDFGGYRLNAFSNLGHDTGGLMGTRLVRPIDHRTRLGTLELPSREEFHFDSHRVQLAF